MKEEEKGSGQDIVQRDMQSDTAISTLIHSRVQ